MTDLELNKALHEKVMGKCWHEFESIIIEDDRGFNYTELLCLKCKLSRQTLHNPSYTTNPADYWELLMKTKNDPDIFRRFLDFHNEECGPYNAVDKVVILLDMPRGCQAIHDFFCKEGE